MSKTTTSSPQSRSDSVFRSLQLSPVSPALKACRQVLARCNSEKGSWLHHRTGKQRPFVSIAPNRFFFFGMTFQISKFVPLNSSTTFRFRGHVKTFWRKLKFCVDEKASSDKNMRTVKVDSSIVGSLLRYGDADCGKP